jgi:hypothetical protein
MLRKRVKGKRNNIERERERMIGNADFMKTAYGFKDILREK